MNMTIEDVLQNVTKLKADGNIEPRLEEVPQPIAPYLRIARREQYRSMMRLAAAHSPWREELATRGVDEARAILRRHDRIEWFLRLWSRDLLNSAQHMPAFTRNQRRRLHRVQKSLGSPPPNQWWNERERFLLHWWRLQVASSRVPFLRSALARVNLRHFRTFRQANAYLFTLEQGVDRVEVHQNAVDDFLVFPSGWRWVRCIYDSSEIEGKLMRHCGNRGNRDPECELLSLREPDRVDRVSFWRPHLTFALKEGYLGEMKGRHNAKPGREYHPYIRALLLDPRIKGLSPELDALPGNDFELSDLDGKDRLKVYLRMPCFEWAGRERSMDKWRTRHRPGLPPCDFAPNPAPTKKQPTIRDKLTDLLLMACLFWPLWPPIIYAIWHASSR